MKKRSPPAVFSQNFTKNKKLIKHLVSTAHFTKEDIVLDIGAGRGALTFVLANTVRQVEAIELDKRLSDYLFSRFKDNNSIRVIHIDFLKYVLPTKPYKVFSNIPFIISARIFRKLFFGKHKPVEAIIFIQKEFARKYIGFPKETKVSRKLKRLFNIKIIHKCSRYDFTPPAKVDVVVVHIVKIR